MQRVRREPVEALQPHPQAFLVPPMRPDEWEEFSTDIALRGIKVPLEVDGQGVILDGHHRWRAARELGMELVPVIDVSLDHESSTAYMLKAAVLRRHLTDDQRAIMAALWKEENRKEPQPGPGRGHTAEKTPAARPADVSPTRQEAMKFFNVSRWKVDQASYLMRRDPEAAQEVHRGEKKLNLAYRSLTKHPTETPPLPGGIFDVIYADPPWPYPTQIESWGPTSLHYETPDLEELMAMDVASLAADNATLFLWATNPHLDHALDLAKAWGFTYKTNVVWVKTGLRRPGSGYYIRGRHELLFICAKGSHVPDQLGREPIGSVLYADVQEHSRKPSEVYDLIEDIYPGSKYLELFARNPRKGWVSWGNEHGR